MAGGTAAVAAAAASALVGEAAGDPLVRFARGVDLSGPRAPGAAVGQAHGFDWLCRHSSHHVSLFFFVLLVLAGILAKRSEIFLPSQHDILRQITFKFLFPVCVFRNMWAAHIDRSLASSVLLASIGVHICWFALSLALARCVREDGLRFGASQGCITGWTMLMTQGQNMAFTYGVISESPILADRGMSSAVMWDIGGNIWICQGLIWGIAAFYSPRAQAAAAAKKDDAGGGGAAEVGGVRLVLDAAIQSPLLRASVFGVALNCSGVALGETLDGCLRTVAGPFKVLLYFLAGLYADWGLTRADMRLIGCALAQRAAIQLLIGGIVYFVLPLPSPQDRQAILLAVCSPVVSIIVHILAENDYGDHLVKLAVTGGLLNIAGCTFLQHLIVEFVFSDDG